MHGPRQPEWRRPHGCFAGRIGELKGVLLPPNLANLRVFVAATQVAMHGLPDNDMQAIRVGRKFQEPRC
jgi:hypothetical protein